MGEVFLIVADDLDVALLQLVNEHDQGAVQPCVHVDFLGGRLVHVRVRLDRPDQLRDARRPTLDLPQQLVTGHRRPQPEENAAERFFRYPSASPSSQVVSCPAPARVGEISHPSSTPRSSIHIASSSSRSLTSSESSEATIPDPRATSCGSAATMERCSRVRGRFPSSAAFSDASWKALRASAALRAIAAAGLFSSWARP